MRRGSGGASRGGATGAGSDPEAAWLAGLPLCPAIGSIDDMAEDADIAAGCWRSYRVVSGWLDTRGNTDFKPLDEWLTSFG